MRYKHSVSKLIYDERETETQKGWNGYIGRASAI